MQQTILYQIINANINSLPKNEFLNKLVLNRDQGVLKLHNSIGNQRINFDPKTPKASDFKADPILRKN